MDKILTISVAAYNMEKYIEQNLSSMVIPEIINDLEVFIIDDGGTDGAMEFPAHMYYTDIYLFTIPFAFLHSIQYLCWPVYCYRLDREGQSTAHTALARHVDTIMYLCEQLCVFYETQKKLQGDILVYVRHRVSAVYLYMIKALLYRGISKTTLQQLKGCEKKIQQMSQDIYLDAERQHRKMGLVLKWFRKTNYTAFWLLKLVPFVSR